MVTSLQSLCNKKWLEMPAKRKTSSFIRYSEAKITLLALYMSVMKSPKLECWNVLFGIIGLTD